MRFTHKLKGNLFLILNLVYFITSFIVICVLMKDKLKLMREQTGIQKYSNGSWNKRLVYKSKLFELTEKSAQIKDLALLESITHLRRAYGAAQEIFNYVSVTFNKTDQFDKALKNRILSEISDRKNVVELEIDKVGQTTGLERFKIKRLDLLSNQIASRIWELQNPPKQSCNKIKGYVCRLIIDAGFGAGIHEILWCLVSAFYTNRTVVLIADWDKYFGKTEKWENIFLPLSTCDYKSLRKEGLNDHRRLNTALIRKLLNQLPKEYGPELVALVDSPNSWFHSQFMAYILRPQPRLKRYIDEFKVTNDFKHPIVGIQVRRTDKITYKEGLYYPVSDYMTPVKDFFDKIDLTQMTERRVYVASDDPSVLPELSRSYPGYTFIGSTDNAKLAFSESTRYSNSSLWGVLTDIYLLSETDFIVCTFSSAICRISYQLMRYKGKDSSFQYRSLDTPYIYHHSLTPVRTAFYNHQAKSSDQWTLKIGDHLHERIGNRERTEWWVQAINGRGWDSYFFASNSSNQTFYKLYPNYKVYDDIEFV